MSKRKSEGVKQANREWRVEDEEIQGVIYSVWKTPKGDALFVLDRKSERSAIRVARRACVLLNADDAAKRGKREKNTQAGVWTSLGCKLYLGEKLIYEFTCDGGSDLAYSARELLNRHMVEHPPKQPARPAGKAVRK